jgi:hypothetical protein
LLRYVERERDRSRRGVADDFTQIVVADAIELAA